MKKFQKKALVKEEKKKIIYAVCGESLKASVKIGGRKRTINRDHRGPVNLSACIFANNSAASMRIAGSN